MGPWPLIRSRRPFGTADSPRADLPWLAPLRSRRDFVPPAVAGPVPGNSKNLARIVDREVGKTRDRIFTPLVTLATFLGRLLAEGHSCQAAPDRLIAWRVARGLPACSADTGGYRKARRRLPEALLPELVREAADRIDGLAPEGWLFHGRRVVITGGSTVSMRDTPENQAEYPFSYALSV